MLLANAQMKSFGPDTNLNILYLQNQYYTSVIKSLSSL